MSVIQELHAIEILDSRGRPTIKAYCTLAGGASASASVPSGASTGLAEALELRDGDPTRYRGLGCRTAVSHINGEIRQKISGRELDTQAALDRMLIALDGTENKSRLGANALLAVSLAFARATSLEKKIPPYQRFAEILGTVPGTLPRPTINLFSGGKHAGGQVAIQDVLLVPVSARSMNEALAMTFAVYQCAAELIAREYDMRVLRADEGGLAPPAPNSSILLDHAATAIEAAGLKLGRDMCLAVDVASSHFFNNGVYDLDGKQLTSIAMIEVLCGWLRDYPIISLEDGLAESDWEHWPRLRTAAAGRALILGDDLLCTNPKRIQRAINSKAANALLLKVNQIGTLTEAAEACLLARSDNWHVTVSARSGETEDDWLADLAVGWSGNHIKVGSITQSERLAKYNRLLEIEADTGWPLVGHK